MIGSAKRDLCRLRIRFEMENKIWIIFFFLLRKSKEWEHSIVNLGSDRRFETIPQNSKLNEDITIFHHILTSFEQK